MNLKELSIRPRSFIVEVKNELNLNEDEVIVFDCTMKDMSRIQIADRVGCCEKKVTKIKQKIEEKMKYLE